MRKLFLIAAYFFAANFLNGSAFALAPKLAPTFVSTWDDIQKQLLTSRTDIPAEAVNYTFNYLRMHSDQVNNKNVVTLINFARSSRMKRMHVVDMITGKIDDYLVAHGKNSGEDLPLFFSNQIGSNMSSLGMYLTLDPYTGIHGPSMRLSGLEKTNSNVEVRAVVLHGADYVSDEIARTQPRLGRSLGCPAIDNSFTPALMERLQQGSLLYVYSDQPAEVFTEAQKGEVETLRWNGEGSL